MWTMNHVDFQWKINEGTLQENMPRQQPRFLLQHVNPDSQIQYCKITTHSDVLERCVSCRKLWI